MNPTERLEAVLLKTLTKTDLPGGDREALEKAILVARTLPDAGSVKRDLVETVLSQLRRSDAMVQKILSHEELEEENRGPWLEVSKDLQEAISRMEAKKASRERP